MGWDDYVTLNAVMRQDSFWKRHQLVIVPGIIAVGVLAVMLILAVLDGRGLLLTLGTTLTTWLFWVIPLAMVPVILILNRLELWLWFKRQRVGGMDVLVTFDDDRGLHFETRDGSGLLMWQGIRKLVTHNDTHVILQNNRMVGTCLPRRAFASEADFTAVRTHIQQRMAEAEKAK